MNYNSQPITNASNEDTLNKLADVVCPVCNKLTPYENSCRVCGAVFLKPNTQDINYPQQQNIPSINYPQSFYPLQQSYPQSSGYLPIYNQYPPQTNFYNPYPAPVKKTRDTILVVLFSIFLVFNVIFSIVVFNLLVEIKADLSYYLYEYGYDYNYEDDYPSWYDEYFDESEDDPYGGLFNFEGDDIPLPEENPGHVLLNNIAITAYEPKVITIEGKGKYLSYNILIRNDSDAIIEMAPDQFTLVTPEVFDLKSTKEIDNDLGIASMQNTALAVDEEIRTTIIFKIDDDTQDVDLYIEIENASTLILNSQIQ